MSHPEENADRWGNSVGACAGIFLQTHSTKFGREPPALRGCAHLARPVPIGGRQNKRALNVELIRAVAHEAPVHH
jgi:hypothetical protein